MAAFLGLMIILALLLLNRIMTIPSTTYIIYNARIYTVDDRNPFASTVVIKDGRFVRVDNSSPDLLLLEFPDAQTFDLLGKRIVPGLVDSHAVRLETRFLIEREASDVARTGIDVC